MASPLFTASLRSQLEKMMEISSNTDIPANMEDEDQLWSIVSKGSVMPFPEFVEPCNSRISWRFSLQEKLHQFLNLIRLEEVKSAVHKFKVNRRISRLRNEERRPTPKSPSSVKSPVVEELIEMRDMLRTFYEEFELVDVEKIETDPLDYPEPSPGHYQLPNHGPSWGGLLPMFTWTSGPRSYIV